MSVSTANGTATFVYDGDGNRLTKTEDGETILYVNRYFEKNLTTNVTTSYYYLGGKLVAMSENATPSCLLSFQPRIGVRVHLVVTRWNHP